MDHTNAMLEKKVLIVEDDAIISSFIQIKLEEMGCTVCAKARSGSEAIEMANKHRPDLILMDVMIDGEIDGIETVEIITRTLDIPVVYLTASSDENTLNRLMKTEPHGFLIKPFDERVLSSAIHIAIHRHRTKQELFRAKEMLRTTIESIDDHVFSLDANGTIISDHTEKAHRLQILGIKEIEGKNVTEVFPSEPARKLMETIKWVSDYKTPQSIEFSLEEDNKLLWFNAKLTHRKGVNGAMGGITMVMADITESKNIYQELLMSQDKLSETQNIARLGCCDIFFREKKFVYNELFFSILDIDDQQIISRFDHQQLSGLIHPDDRGRYQNILNYAIKNKKADFTINYRIIDRQKNIRHIHSVGKIKFDATGEPSRMILTIQDVSWQKNNEKLRQDVEVARQTAELKQRFFARLSHEIRNPVSGITGLLHLLERTSLDDTQQDYIESLKTASNSLLALLNDVLDFSKIESGMMKVKPVACAMPKIVHNLHTFFTPAALEKKINFRYAVQDDFPAQVLADENKITQVISNFLSNAIKFTEKGFVELQLSFTPNDAEGITMLVEVTDTGAGIARDEKSQLFKDFSQLENGANAKGTGLGLAICSQLVELMGGKIGVKSGGRNKGATFWFSVPVIALDTSGMKELQPADKKQEKRELPECSVLLVEDMVVNQKVIKLILEDMGCKVAVASNGKQAVEMFRETTVNAFDIFAKIHYDIILMDHFMPVMDGLTALRILKKDFESIPPIIVLTADESFAHNNNYREKGFDDCIIKPVKASELFEKVRMHLSKREMVTAVQTRENLSVDDIEKKPVVNKKTLNLIIRQAELNNFNVNILFESFIDDMETIYTQSLSAIEMNDNNEFKRIVLTVKGLSGNIGASQVHATARLMDRLIRFKNDEEAKNLMPLLFEKYSIFKNTIEAEYMLLPIER